MGRSYFAYLRRDNSGAVPLWECGRANTLTIRAPLPEPTSRAMSWLNRLFGGGSAPKSGRLDYVAEARALERQGDFDAALTSYRLALRETPENTDILQAMAIAFTRTHRPEEAMRCYRQALSLDPRLAGAHYGLAFLLLKRQEIGAAAQHLRAFLQDPPTGGDAAGHVAHAEATLRALEAPSEG